MECHALEHFASITDCVLIFLRNGMYFASHKISGVGACATLQLKAVTRGDSASIRFLYTYITSSGDIRYNNWSYVVVV